MSNNWYLVSALTGGAAGALDALDGAALADDARAIAIVEGYAAFYEMVASSGATTSAPDVIAPVTNPGDKRWHLRKALPYTPMYADYDAASADANTVLSPESFAFGSGNQITDPINSGTEGNCILGGYGNVIKEHDWGMNAILNGAENEIQGADTCSINNGQENVIRDFYPSNNNIYLSFIENGWRNNIFGKGDYVEYMFILNGDYNKIWNVDGSSVINGSGNVVTGYQASVINGANSRAYIDGQSVFSNGKITDKGDAQFSYVMAKGATTNATQTEIKNQTWSKLYLKYRRLWKFNIDVSAMQTAGTSGTVGDSAFWSIVGGVKNIGESAAQGKITRSGAFTEDETFTLNTTTYTFKAAPSAITDIDISDTGSGVIENNIAAAIYRNDSNILEVDVSGSYITVTAAPFLGTAPNSWTFTESSAALTMDGSGTFGGTTAGATGTVSLVGTPQGTGVPAATDRDAAAAAWDVTVSADDTNKSLKIEVTGEADKTIHWAAKFSLVEVG